MTSRELRMASETANFEGAKGASKGTQPTNQPTSQPGNHVTSPLPRYNKAIRPLAGTGA